MPLAIVADAQEPAPSLIASNDRDELSSRNPAALGGTSFSKGTSMNSRPPWGAIALLLTPEALARLSEKERRLLRPLNRSYMRKKQAVLTATGLSLALAVMISSAIASPVTRCSVSRRCGETAIRRRFRKRARVGSSTRYPPQVPDVVAIHREQVYRLRSACRVGLTPLEAACRI